MPRFGGRLCFCGQVPRVTASPCVASTPGRTVDILIIAGVRSQGPSGLGRTWRRAITTTVTSVADAAFSDPERFALAGFLAGYSGLTRDA